MKMGIVIVTYNRIELLKRVLEAFDHQTILPSVMVIVNNCSTDGTSMFLEEWRSIGTPYIKKVITTTSNLGGSGGFYTGFTQILKEECDWIWVSDDDAIPDKNAIECAEKFLSANEDSRKISAICGQVINNGKIDLAHRKRMNMGLLKPRVVAVAEDEYKKRFFELNCFSYVGTIINKDSLIKCGLTNPDYFIWYDDTEHSLRLSKVGNIYCVPEICIHHDVGQSTGQTISWKLYYGIRNQGDLLRRHFPKHIFYYYVLQFKIRAIIKLLLGDKCGHDLYMTAINDCINEKFGIHNQYKPGWSVDTGNKEK